MVREDVLLFPGRKVGLRHSCFVIAEAGVNHNQNKEMAHDLVDAAADAGADAVKFQTWITEEICVPGAAKAAYQETANKEDQFTMLKKLELPFEWHSELKEHAENRGILFLSTPDEIKSARFLCNLGVAALKIGSAEVTNLPYLARLAALGKPLILSTGMATTGEIERAFEEILLVDREAILVLLHCVSAYPAPEEEMNLRCIQTLREVFDVPVGLSDHTTGEMAAIAGAAMGMSVYERHLTLDRRLPGPDQSASTEPRDFAKLIETIRKTERMMGSGIKAASDSERNVAQAVRRVLAYGRDLPAGHGIADDDIVPLRCGKPGLPPGELRRFTGRTLRKAALSGAPVDAGDFV